MTYVQLSTAVVFRSAAELVLAWCIALYPAVC